MSSVLYLDDRKGAAGAKAQGSSALRPIFERAGVRMEFGLWNSDIEFLGWTPLGLTPIGFEHKSVATADIFTSMTDGRLNGTQLPTMVRHYPWVRYVIIEGNTRRSAKDGVLEIWKFDHDKGRFDWCQAFSRNGAGFTYDEFENRIESIQEFFSHPHCQGRTIVKQTYDAQETAAYILGRLHYWSKPYEEHTSARQWDRSKEHELLEAANPLTSTRDIPLVKHWAAAIDGVGPHKASYVAAHFKTPVALALGSVADWTSVEWRDRKTGSKKYHFSKRIATEIVKQIQEG